MQHINPISIHEILFALELFAGELVHLTTNRIKKGSFLPAVALYPVLFTAIRMKLLRKKYRRSRLLYKRHIKWVLHPANLMDRITIAVGRKVETTSLPSSR